MSGKKWLIAAAVLIGAGASAAMTWYLCQQPPMPILGAIFVGLLTGYTLTITLCVLAVIVM